MISRLQMVEASRMVGGVVDEIQRDDLFSLECLLLVLCII